MTANMFVRDMDLHFDRLDGRRLEVVAGGLPLHGRAQLAIGATLVSALKRDGTRARTATKDGATLVDARRSCLGKTENVVWLSWVVRWQDVGPPRLASDGFVPSP